MFKESIQKVVEGAPGGLAGILMGFDGIAVQGYTVAGEATDMEAIAMEFAHILKQFRGATEQPQFDGLDEVTVKTSKMTVIARTLSAEYFVACAIAPGGNVGKARYLLRITSPEMQADL